MSYLITLSLCLLSSLAFAANGILELDSKPGGAEVFVDGKKKGVTPDTAGQKLTMELPEGDHVVQIKKEGVGSATEKVFIGEGVIQPLTLTIMAEAFTNSLGMKFVPVPGTKVLMCIHETRNKDYAAYAAENADVDRSWKNVSFEFTEPFHFQLKKTRFTLTDDAVHPVVNVSWKDATAFCAWLGRKDGKTYRLPTDHEWSCAVGIGEQENALDTPEAKSGQVAGFPWGARFPPPKDNMGNYSDSTAEKRSKGAMSAGALAQYDDGWMLTAPVMSYPANQLGIFDLGGNVWELCQDVYSPTSSSPVLRGGAWNNLGIDYLASSSRNGTTPTTRFNDNGFRCVVVIDGSPR